MIRIGVLEPRPAARTKERMKTHGLSSNAVLLVVDVQRGLDEPIWGRRNNPHMERNIETLLVAWRSSKWPVIFFKHMSTWATSPLRPGQPGNEFKPECAPVPGERILKKSVNSCFIGTSLEADLRRAGCDTLVIVGLTTNHCISTTARMAGNLGFTAYVVSDATATFDRTGPDGVEYKAELIQAMTLSDLNHEFATIIDTKGVISELRLL